MTSDPPGGLGQGALHDGPVELVAGDPRVPTSRLVMANRMVRWLGLRERYQIRSGVPAQSD